MSTPSSALPTPVDEFASSHGSDGIKGNGINGKVKVVDEPDLGEARLSEGIQQMCGV